MCPLRVMLVEMRCGTFVSLPWIFLLALGTVAQDVSKPAAACFNGRDTLWSCCAAGSGMINSKSPCPWVNETCCYKPITVSSWYVRQVHCWAGIGNNDFGSPLKMLNLQQRCCDGDGYPENCFTQDYPLEMCCVRPRLKSTAMLAESGAWDKIAADTQGSQCTTNHTDGRVECQPDGDVRGYLLYCGPQLFEMAYHFMMMVSALRYMLIAWHHTKEQDANSQDALLAQCYQLYDKTVRDMPLPIVSTMPVIMLSPMLEDFTVFTEGHALDAMAELALDDDRFPVIGFPTMTSGKSGRWEWPIFRIRHQYWKLSAARYSLGYESWPAQAGHPTYPDERYKTRGPQHCFGGDTTSGTRIYRYNTLRSLMVPRYGRKVSSTWMLELDMALKRTNVPAFTCIVEDRILLEEHYLRHVKLDEDFAAAYLVEGAKFHPDAEVQMQCKPMDCEGAIDLNNEGLAISYCYRVVLRRAMKLMKDVWANFQLDYSPDGSSRTLPLFGTLLNLFRSGLESHELMPWEFDADFVLSGVPRHRRDELAQRFKAVGLAVLDMHELHEELGMPPVQSPMYASEEQHWQLNYEDHGQIVEIDLFVSPQFTRGVFDLRPQVETTLEGVPMHIGSEPLRWLLERTKNRGTSPWRTKKSNLTTCTRPGHNACLPDVQRDSRYHRIPHTDSFWRLDIWDDR